MKGEVRLCDLLATCYLFKVPQPNSVDKSRYPTKQLYEMIRSDCLDFWYFNFYVKHGDIL
jgi:hypothetical protein